MSRVKVMAGGVWKAPGTSSTPGGSGGGSGSTGSFAHPGVMYSAAQLASVASQITANAEPWRGLWSSLLGDTASGGANDGRAYSSTAWVPTPRAQVGRGSSGSPSQGDDDLQNDSTAALVDAFAWRWTGDRARASKACQIMNAWSSTHTEILFDTATWSDGKLLAGWVATRFARAAEIMRYSDWTPATGETALNVGAFETYLQNVYVPRMIDGHSGGAANWLMTFCDGLVQIGAFRSDTSVFNAGLNMWRENVPACFWMPGDVNRWPQLSSSTPPSTGLPISPPGGMYDKSTASASDFRVNYWRNPQSWPAGLPQELGRDLHHTGMIFAACANAAETAWHQGVDLYAEEQARIVAASELFCKLVHARYVLGQNPPTGWPFSGTPSGYQTAFQRATMETIYHHYAGRRNVSMPNTLAFLTDYGRTSTHNVDVFCVAEELTYRGTP